MPARKPVRKVLICFVNLFFSLGGGRSEWQCLHKAAPLVIGSLQKGHFAFSVTNTIKNYDNFIFPESSFNFMGKFVFFR